MWAHRGAQQAPEPTQGKGCPGSGCAMRLCSLFPHPWFDCRCSRWSCGMWDQAAVKKLCETSREKPCRGLPPWPRSCIYTLVTWAVADPRRRLALLFSLECRATVSRVGEGAALPALLHPLAPCTLQRSPTRDGSTGERGSSWGGNMKPPSVRNQLPDHPNRHPLGVRHWGWRGKHLWRQQGAKECLGHLKFHG